MLEAYRVDFSSLTWESPIPGVRHKLQRTGGSCLRLVEYRPEMEPHWCARGHVGMILEGRFEIEFDAGTSVFEPGDGVCIPDGEQHRHRARCLTDVVRAIFVEDVPVGG